MAKSIKSAKSKASKAKPVTKPVAAPVSVKVQTSDTVAMAELYEARARVAKAQTEIALAHFERKQYQSKMAEIPDIKRK